MPRSVRRRATRQGASLLFLSTPMGLGRIVGRWGVGWLLTRLLAPVLVARRAAISLRSQRGVSFVTDKMALIPDAALLSRCRVGDREAFGLFYARHRAAILGYLARRVPFPEAAADLMAETFAKAFEVTLDHDRRLPAAPRAWLYSIARNLLLDGLRRGQVDATARLRLGMEPLALDDHDIERIAEIAAATEALNGVLAELPKAERDLLRARVIDEDPYAELASRLRCSEAVVRKRLSRTMAHLRTAIGAHDV